MPKQEEKNNDDKSNKTKSNGKMYVLAGSKNPGEIVDRIIIEGTSSNPVVWIDRHNAAELTEEEVKDLRAQGHILAGVDESKATTSTDSPQNTAQQQAAQVPPTGSTLT